MSKVISKLKNSLGILNNNAEIYESYNEQGLQDIDSKAGNEIPTEDDMSNADIAVSIVTGKIVGYTTLTLFILAILVFGILSLLMKWWSKNSSNSPF